MKGPNKHRMTVVGLDLACYLQHSALLKLRGSKLGVAKFGHPIRCFTVLNIFLILKQDKKVKSHFFSGTGSFQNNVDQVSIHPRITEMLRLGLDLRSSSRLTPFPEAESCLLRIFRMLTSLVQGLIFVNNN